jgi:hypothetical protein
MFMPRIVSIAHQSSLDTTIRIVLTKIRSLQSATSGQVLSPWSFSQAPTSSSSTDCQSTSKASTTQTLSAPVFVCWH